MGKEMPMPNDAKLGLLVGVVGVIVAAVISSNRPQVAIAVQQQAAPTAFEKAQVTTDQKAAAVVGSPPVVPTVFPAELASTPVIRSKREPNATAASRSRTDDDLEP